MGLFVKNSNTALRFALNILQIFGFLTSYEHTGKRKMLFNMYWLFWFMFIVGFITIAQAGDMFNIWGDIPLMTSAAFLLFTNVALTTKIMNVVARRSRIHAIIDQADDELRTAEAAADIVQGCNRETTKFLCVYMWLSAMTVFGWAASAEKNQLPLRAWYPFDVSESPAYELAYADQSAALIISALVNVCLDTLVTSLIALCRCRLRIVALSLRTLCHGLPQAGKHTLSPIEDEQVYDKLKQCIKKHEAALKAAREIQACFSVPILSQFTVSIVIICVTAYQLAMEVNNKNWVRIISMGAYLLCMIMQVFLYCYQGHHLSEESADISSAAYECPWHMCSARFRRALLIVMVRTRKTVVLTACGLTTLSLHCFTSIIKASYTFFTVLRQVEFKD